MSSGRQYLNEMDALLSQTVERVVDENVPAQPLGHLPAPSALTTTGTTGYPELNVPDLLKTMEEFKTKWKEVDEQLLDALVSIINRSPYSVPQWAGMLKMTLPELVETCHRKDPVTNAFRKKVAAFFQRFRERERIEWSELV